MSVSEKVAKILLDINAVTLSLKKPYRYASGILSPVYTDCRILMSFPKERKIIRDFYIDLINQTGNFDVIAGTATAGIPHAAWIAEKMNLPMIYIRGSSKDHGKGNQIEGIVNKNSKAAVIEDLISTGISSIDSANAIRKAGGKATHVFAITTYEIAVAKQKLMENKLKLLSLTNFSEIVKMAEKLNLISRDQIQKIFDWTKDPKSWGKEMGFEK